VFGVHPFGVPYFGQGPGGIVAILPPSVLLQFAATYEPTVPVIGSYEHEIDAPATNDPTLSLPAVTDQ
jgi:hypothetical protein